jgi:hypothetical protein
MIERKTSQTPEAPDLLGCIIFGVGEGILSETEIAHLK